MFDQPNTWSKHMLDQYEYTPQPAGAQAVIAAIEEPDGADFAVELDALDQTFRSLGAAAPSPVILNFKAFNRNTLKGVFDLELPSGLVTCGAMLHESHGKFWVAMPGKPYAKPDGSQAWSKVLDFRDRETSDKFQRTVTPIAIATLERMREAS
jgi:hypothetical protein